MNKICVLTIVCVCWSMATLAAAQAPPASGIKPIPRKSPTKKPAPSTKSTLSDDDLLNLFKQFSRELERKTRQKDEERKPKSTAVTDPQLLALHRDFLIKLEKAGVEFEEDEKLAKAVEAYNAILRIVPNHPGANQGLQRIFNLVATNDREVVTIHADKAWQSTGVALSKGTPVRITAKGTWSFTLEMELTPEGITIPDELKNYKMGSLIGVILAPGEKMEAGASFHVGDSKQFIARKTGILYLRMYDIDPRDNDGELDVMIQSTFVNR